MSEHDGCKSNNQLSIKMTSLNYILARKLRKAKNKKQNGFTLVELMVVIVIVGILSAVALPQLNSAQDRAKDAVAKQEAIAAAKDCSVFLLAGGDEPDGAQYGDVDVTAGCASVVSTSPTGATFTIPLTDGVPGEITEG